MKIEFLNDYGKHYAEILPSIIIGWGIKKRIMISWLWFAIDIKLNK